MKPLFSHFLLGILGVCQISLASADTGVAKRPQLKLCTATAGNIYHQIGSKIARHMHGAVDVDVVETKGSWENLETMSAMRPRCDAILAQEDAVLLHQFQNPESKMAMERVTSVFEEKLHILCNRKVRQQDLSEIKAGDVEILTNDYGSGSYITWRMLMKLNKKYRRFGSEERGLDGALLRLLDNDRPTCLFFVAGLNGRTLKRAENNFSDRLKLISLTDESLTVSNGRLKKPLYKTSLIPASAYPKLSKVDVKTLAVNAVFFVSTRWKDGHPDGFKALNNSLLDLMVKPNGQDQKKAKAAE